MNPVAKRVMAAGNRAASWVYRRSNGRFGGSAGGVPVLLLTVAGRMTGKPRSAPVGYFEHDNGYLVAASAGGAKTDPQWIKNLEAARHAHVQIREDQFDVDARITAGPERDALWQNVVLTKAPRFARYEEKSGRRIPVAFLTRRP